MKEVKYVPSACKGKDADFDGYVVYLEPDVDAYLDYMEEISADIDEDKRSLKEDLKSTRKMINASEKFYKKIEITDGDKEFKSFADLKANLKCFGILVEVARQIMSEGNKVQKNVNTR